LAPGGFSTNRQEIGAAKPEFYLGNPEVRRLAIKDELLAMRLRGRLVVPVSPQKVGGQKGLATG
jgi:hypothetical protein